jgi:hypothetical protein
MTKDELRKRQRSYEKKYQENNKEKRNQSNQKWRKTNPEKVREYYKRGYTKTKAKRLHDKYYTSEKYKQWKRTYKKLYPEKYIAWDKANNATKIGRLKIERKCQLCNQTSRTQKHHTDYAKPLKIIWLCPSCHRHIHAHRMR